MKAPQTLRQPANWQDFESLCKKLWGEIWNCSEILKNGRNGQSQHGVDVYGMPLGEKQYFGIQCKGKEEYGHKQFSESEIDNEIEKVKSFDPPLKKLYFATTAVKDAKIEAYIRKKNIEHINAGLFEIHLYSWEDIVDLIDENRQTHAWYVNSQNYKGSKSISVTFADDNTVISVTPKFKQSVTIYTRKTRMEATSSLSNLEIILKQQKKFARLQDISYAPFDHDEVNESFFSIKIKVTNTESEPLEEFKVLFDIKGDIQDIATTNIIKHSLSSLVGGRYHEDISISKTNNRVTGIPRRKVLVGDDIYIFDKIFIKPLAQPSNIDIHWKFLSKDHRDSGILQISSTPDIEKTYKYQTVDDPNEARNEEGPVEDFITSKK